MENTNLDPAQPPLGPPRPSLLDRPAGDEPRALGNYRLLRRLGEGGMGAVFLGYEARGGRQVAIKVLNEALVGNQGYVDRFYREAKSGSALEHANLVHTHAAGQDRATGKHYLVMEYVDGPSAHALLAGHGPLPVGDAVHLALQIARGLEYAHSRHFVHRDIKPDNILLTRSGVAKLGDMGLAKRTDDAANHLTGHRQGFGTTAYMPYEQAVSAKTADGRSDLYALGATLYHLLTGHVPFPGDNHLEVVEKKKQGWFRPASALAPHVPATLDAILARMMACQPRDRYQTASELIIDLERSRLAAAVPTFADPELMRHDPQALALMGPSEPTRLDPETPVRHEADEWIVRYRNRSGRAMTTRQSTEDVIERLKEGTLPRAATARRPTEDEARPLVDVPEFRPFLPPDEGEAETDDEPARSAWGLLPILIPVAAVLAAVAGLAALWLRGRG